MNEVDIKKAASRLHIDLREAKLSEKDKILLTNSILIALKDPLFREGYGKYKLCKISKGLMNDICNVVGNEIAKVSSDLSVKERIIARLWNIYATCFSSCDPKEEYSLQYFVHACHTELCDFAVEKPYDVAGMLYHEFIRYSAGNRTSLGIVLTPYYVADFMADLIDIDHHSSVIDICCGSGSLLSSAYKKSLLCSGSENSATFTGCELDEDTYYASLMSMILQGNQSGTILHGNAFSDEIQKKLLGKKYNKSLMNPPYAQINQNEFMFMMLALDLLETGGELAVICPSGCATGRKFKQERKSIMLQHTLKAVFSIPGEIFNGNGAAVNPCIMVWEAHRPHNPAQPTYFGYYKDKEARKFDVTQWKANAKRWLHCYKNKIVVEGESTMHCVTDTDEWLCEGYMETDYSNLTKTDFEDTLLEYLAYTVKAYGASRSGGTYGA